MSPLVSMIAWYVLTAGCLLLLTGTGQLVGAAARWRTERRRRQAAVDVRRAASRRWLARLASGREALVARRPAWDGWRRLRVARIEAEGDDCRSFYLEDPRRTPLPPFRAGQYLTIGLSAGDRPAAARCYSLSQACDPRQYRITVKRIDGGAVSERLFTELTVGDTLLAKAPAGRFVAPPGDHPLVLVGGGIGITPLLAIAQQTSELEPGRGVWVFYQMRDLDHAPLLSDLVGWARGHRGARLFVFASRWPGTPPDWLAGQGRVDAAGLLDRCAALQSTGPTRVRGDQGVAIDADFLICGPDAMVTQLRCDLVTAGVPAERIGSERFHVAAPSAGSADGAANPTGGRPERGGYRVRVQAGASGFDCDPGRETLLEAAEAAGQLWPSGCRRGECGECVVRLLRGRVAYAEPPGFESLANDEALACVARPLEDVEISLLSEAE